MGEKKMHVEADACDGNRGRKKYKVQYTIRQMFLSLFDSMVEYNLATFRSSGIPLNNILQKMAAHVIQDVQSNMSQSS